MRESIARSRFFGCLLASGVAVTVFSCDGPIADRSGRGEPPNDAGTSADGEICGDGVANRCGAGAVPSCDNGAVRSSCTCGSTQVNAGYCCGGVAQPRGCVRVRLDAGLASGTSSFDGDVFAPLLPYLTGGSAKNSSEGLTKSYPIGQTDHDALYQREIWVSGPSPATFTIPIDNGNYSVHLHFVDWSRSNAGQRRFHVDLQGSRVLTDLDIVSEVGPSVALVKSFDVAVTNSAIELTITNNLFYAEIAAVEILPRGDPHLPTTAPAGNAPPTVDAGDDQAITPPTTSVTLSAAASDPDGDTLSYAWTQTAGGAATIATPDGASTLVTGLVAGAHTFTVTVDDGQGGTASDSVVVNVGGGTVVGPAWYVSPKGLDSNAGTSATGPFRTLEKARAAARASTTKTIYLLDGVYPRTATLHLGPADAGQSWLGFPGQTPVLDGGGATDTAILVQANNVTIRWLTIRDFKRVGIFGGKWSTVTGLVIDSNTVVNTISDDWTQGAIIIGGTVTGAQITHNLIDGAEYNGIAGYSVVGMDITGLTIANNAVYDTCRSIADCGAIYVIDRGHTSTNVTIDNNIVGDYGSVSTGGRGIYLDDDMSNVKVRYNIVYGTGQWAFQIHGGDHNFLTNNVFDISGAVRLGLYQDAGLPNYGMGANAFSCNVVFSTASPPSRLWDKYGDEPVALPTVSSNLYWGTTGALPNTGAIVDTSPTVADPMFGDPAARDYGFTAGNPAAFCGFQPIDVSQVGPQPNL